MEEGYSALEQGYRCLVEYEGEEEKQGEVGDTYGSGIRKMKVNYWLGQTSPRGHQGMSTRCPAHATHKPQ